MTVSNRRRPSRGRAVRLTKTVHRWSSLAFVVVLVSAALEPAPPTWLAPFMVLPIVLMLVTGLVLQVRHVRSRRRRRTRQELAPTRPREGALA